MEVGRCDRRRTEVHFAVGGGSSVYAGSRWANQEEQCYGIPNFERFPRVTDCCRILGRDAPHG